MSSPFNSMVVKTNNVEIFPPLDTFSSIRPNNDAPVDLSDLELIEGTYFKKKMHFNIPQSLLKHKRRYKPYIKSAIYFTDSRIY